VGAGCETRLTPCRAAQRVISRVQHAVLSPDHSHSLGEPCVCAPYASSPVRDPCGKISRINPARRSCSVSRRSAGTFCHGSFTISVIACTCVCVIADLLSALLSDPSRSSSSVGIHADCHQPLKVRRLPLCLGLTVVTKCADRGVTEKRTSVLKEAG